MDKVNSVIEPNAPEAPPESPVQSESGKPTDGSEQAPDGGPTGGDDGAGGSFFDSLPDDWRTQMVQGAGFDDDPEKYVKQLERVPDLNTLTKNYFEAQEKIRQGMKNAGLPDDATPEQIAEYRDANNIPMEVSGYYDSLPEGLVLGDDDKAVLDPILEIAHENNVSADIMGQMIETQMDQYAKEAKDTETMDTLHQQDAVATLQSEWGGEYQTNMNLAKKTIADMPKGLQDLIMDARFLDGRGVMNSPEFLSYLAHTAKAINPQATITLNENFATEKERYSELTKMMGDDQSEYWKGQNREDLQKEWRELDAKYGK